MGIVNLSVTKRLSRSLPHVKVKLTYLIYLQDSNLNRHSDFLHVVQSSHQSGPSLMLFCSRLRRFKNLALVGSGQELASSACMRHR